MSAARSAAVPRRRRSMSQAQLQADRERLETALAALPPAEVPCRAGRIPQETWIADDPARQRAAALACLACPVLEECWEYIAAHRREAGTYAALTSTDRRSAGPLRDTRYRQQPEE